MQQARSLGACSEPMKNEQLAEPFELKACWLVGGGCGVSLDVDILEGPGGPIFSSAAFASKTSARAKQTRTSPGNSCARSETGCFSTVSGT